MAHLHGMQRVLVWHIGHLGDTIVAIPAIRAVRESFRNARLIIVTNRSEEKSFPESAEILNLFDFIDEIVTYDPASLRSQRGRKKFAELIHSLGPEAVVYLGRMGRPRLSVWRDWIFFRWLGIKHLYGFRPGKPVFWKRLAKKRAFPKETDWLLEKLQLDGLTVPTHVSFDLPITEADVRQVDNLWKEWQIDGHDGPVVAVCAGAKMPANRWPEERYAELGWRLRNERQCFLVAVGGPEDRETAIRLIEEWGGGANACGETDFMASADLLRRSNIYVGNDTGTIHLAAAVGTPCIGVYSARNPRGIWEPYGEGHIVLRKRVPCEFCLLEKCDHPNHPCITGIEVREVFDACSRSLALFQEKARNIRAKD